ncbi:reverse transcriptase family protein [Chryseobacterium indoltheticum]|uniref:RNA-directed DNA polymerase n=1 Tax=Chryseobacterium indoltheticum TaxID=254 RepID=A0A381FBL1_9FLAO|nr:reverse transcriptase family protein [Chryseobacterium indoltheticum]AZA73775.1 RNA-directed DNA polymerase [Chryseobacterium indoltheticum]SIQ94809.1 Reverse transcriptase (RNA-dependent DNA polymerase) [Chryseobacterium indoltheticum]SUX43976.1 Retron-type reverse transcriptase [Chryseobacterium indoltheticum]
MKHSELITKQDLANYLRCDLEFIEKIIEDDYFIRNLDRRNIEELRSALTSNKILVDRFNLRKKGQNGGFRTVHRVWTAKLNNTLKILNHYLVKIHQPSEMVHGFVKGKNIRSNAECHLEKKIVLSVDIKDYFETITESMVTNSLKKLGFKDNVALWIAKITTIENQLVQGFCTSPTLANIVTHSLDEELKSLCGSNIRYSRYADDLYFSSNTDILPLDDIQLAVEKYGFLLNEKKTKFMKRGQKQFVTGLTIFDSHSPRISKNRKKNIRLEINCITKFGYTAHAKHRLIARGEDPKDLGFLSKLGDEVTNTRNRLYGWLHFIQSIEPQFAKKYYKKLNDVGENSVLRSTQALEILLQIRAGQKES